MMEADCPNCSAGDGGRHHSPNLGVIMGVLGGMALVGIFVLIVVPIARARKRRKSRANTREDIERAFLSCRRSSFLRQKIQHAETQIGPDVLLPLIDPVSNVTWSDLRSKNSSADSTEEAAYSFLTDNATISHNGPRKTSAVPDNMGKGIVDGQVSPSTANLGPTAPGLLSKIAASTATAGPSHSSMPAPQAHSAHPSSTTMLPLSPLSPVLSDVGRRPSYSKGATQRRGMEPVLEDNNDRYRGSRQLPSPPASPDQTHPNVQGTGSSKRRPSVTGSHSAPSALPFRPRSATGPSIPLTAAFRTSLLHSNTQSSHTSHTASTSQRYPSVTVPSPHTTPRSRASTISLDLGPQEARPVDASRRMSTTDIRHRHPSTATTEDTATLRAAEQARAFLRPAEALRTPQYQEVGPSSWHRPERPTSLAPQFSTPSYSRVSPASSTSADTVRSPPPPNMMLKQQHSHQNQPALVRRKESSALRPLPVSPFVHSVVSKPMPRAPSGSSTRNRSHSVMSERPLPRHIPPLDPLPPTEVGGLLVPEDDDNSDSSRTKSA